MNDKVETATIPAPAAKTLAPSRPSLKIKKGAVMRVLAFDLATKKDIIVYDGEKTEKIVNSVQQVMEFFKKLGDEKIIAVYEAGVGDSLKKIALKLGHAGFWTSGQNTKAFREASGIEKTDENDAKVIYDMFSIWQGKTAQRSRESTAWEPSSPAIFYPFTELDGTIASMRILYRKHELLKEDCVREQNRLAADRLQYQISSVAAKELKEIEACAEAAIKMKKKQMEMLKEQIGAILDELPIWKEKWEAIKYFGPAIVGGLIAEVGRSTATHKDQLRKFAGMIPKADYNKKRSSGGFKKLLYLATGMMAMKASKYRPHYDAVKAKYQTQHPDWSKGKIEGYTRRVLMTELLIEFWRDMQKFGMLATVNPSSLTTAHSAPPASQPHKKGKATRRPPVKATAPTPSLSSKNKKPKGKTAVHALIKAKSKSSSPSAIEMEAR